MSSCSKWNASKPRMEISKGCACPIPTDICTGMNTNRTAKANVTHIFRLLIPFGNCGPPFKKSRFLWIFSFGKTKLIFPFTFQPKFPDFGGKVEPGYYGHQGDMPGGGGYSTKFYTGSLHLEIQTLTLLYTVFERKGTPFVYLS